MLAHIGTGTPSKMTSDCMIKRVNCMSARSAKTTTDMYATGLMLISLKAMGKGHVLGMCSSSTFLFARNSRRISATASPGQKR